MPINLTKGQKVDLTKGTPGLTKLMVGLGWDVNSFDTGGDFDLDAAAFLLGESGKVYLGCNVENGAFSPTICAERGAFARAICDGERSFRAIAVVGGAADGEIRGGVSPCGVCRQVMSEFCGEDFEIVFADGSVRTLAELLPAAFGL